MKLVTLREYIDDVGWLQATINLERAEQTLITRLKSGKDWRVGKVGKVFRCIMIDKP